MASLIGVAKKQGINEFRLNGNWVRKQAVMET